MENRIRMLRKEKKITQVKLSTELGVTQETISAYENGRHNPSTEILGKMADYFNVSIDYIMGTTNTRTALVDSQYSDEEQSERARLLRFYQLLSKLNRAKLLSYAEGLYDAS